MVERGKARWEKEMESKEPQPFNNNNNNTRAAEEKESLEGNVEQMET